MKTLELVELKKMSAAKLEAELQNAYKALFETKFKVRNSESKNSHMIKNYKKYIAQIKTVIHNQPSNPVQS